MWNMLLVLLLGITQTGPRPALALGRELGVVVRPVGGYIVRLSQNSEGNKGEDEEEEGRPPLL